MKEILTERVKSKFNVALLTQQRILAGHPEKVCRKDAQDWSNIVEQCYSLEEIYERYIEWYARIEAYEAKLKGMIH